MILLTSTIAACATYESAPNPWDDIERMEVGATRAITPPELEGDLGNLQEVLEVTLANAEIADENAAALDEAAKAYNALIEAGAKQHELTELRGRIIVEERRARLWEKLATWPLIAILGVAAVQ